jgi:hypothetical protein
MHYQRTIAFRDGLFMSKPTDKTSFICSPVSFFPGYDPTVVPARSRPIGLVSIPRSANISRVVKRAIVDVVDVPGLDVVSLDRSMDALLFLELVLDRLGRLDDLDGISERGLEALTLSMAAVRLGIRDLEARNICISDSLVPNLS